LKILLAVVGTAAILVALLFALFWWYPFFSLDLLLGSNPFPSDRAYFLVLGLDDAGEAGADRTDVIALLGLDWEHKTVHFVSVPRDLIVPDPIQSTQAVKINSVFKNHGQAVLQKSLESLFHVSIDRVLAINYEVFEWLGDMLGPIPVTITTPMHYEDLQQNLSIHFEPGTHELNGAQLLEYIRFRNDPQGDLGRMERQKQILQKIMDQLKVARPLSFYLQFLEGFFTRVSSNLQTEDLLFLGLHFSTTPRIVFHSFPFRIGFEGQIVLDESRFPAFLSELTAFSTPDAQVEPSMVFLNGTSLSEYLFSIELYNFMQKKGLPVRMLPMPIKSPEIRNWLGEQNALILVSHSPDVQQQMQQQLQETFGEPFACFSPEAGNGLDHYFQLLYYLTQNRQFFHFPPDALVYVHHIPKE